ncbi:ABC transporter substrate-binding protein [Longimonas halophila]|uniref:ABC transporter substrate-binding protein n=1 Tax=Longimonas halophila TaxID=1469170 RepID=A0A2H3NQH7_9BACT|nr:glycine betaine ABC transporter substrate-binding protein [Longimonas halophila]PEN09447.1 ABC transporter substrate-binding protein [Longimonas halophila]
MMNSAHASHPSSSSWTTLVAVFLLAGGLLFTGCSSSSDGDASGERESIRLVYVNWVEGIAMAHVMHELLQDSLNVEVEQMSEVTGGGTAFTSVASGGSDVFVEAWLPTTHSASWEQHSGDLQKIGQWYDRTTVGLTVPTYTDLESVEDLAEHREALDGRIHGIESGATVNQQTRDVLAENNIEGFEVLASSGPATWSELQRAIQNEEPIVVTGWQPHWKWGRYDLRYLEGAQTGQSDVFGEPEDIFAVARTDFEEEFPERVVQFFDNVKVNNEQISSLMQPFRPDADTDDPYAAAQDWIQNHPDLVSSWIPENADASTATASAQ